MTYLELCAHEPQKFFKDWQSLTLIFPCTDKVPVLGCKFVGKGDDKHAVISLLDVWFAHTRRKTCAGTKFVPYPEDYLGYSLLLPKDFINLYTGLRYEERDYIGKWNVALEPWQLNCSNISERGKELLELQTHEARRCVAWHLLHELYVWCRGYKDRIQYALTWKAKKLQHPYWKPNTCLVLYGKEGAGKTTHANEYGYLFGDHYLQFANLENNLQNFSRADQEHAVFALVDEAYPSKDPGVQARMRALISDHYTTLHLKYEHERKIQNFMGIMFASNNFHAIQTSSSARRFCIFDCLHTRPAKDKIHATYMESKLQTSAFPGYDDGLQSLLGFYMDKSIFTEDILDEFRDGALLPPSIETVLGSQRAMENCSVTLFWYMALDRGYIISPEQNPIHPANLESCKDHTGRAVGKELIQMIHRLSDVGYRSGVDFYQPIPGDDTPVHFIGHSWACVLLEDSVYGAYQFFHTENKSYGFGHQPQAAPHFWAKTHEIFMEKNRIPDFERYFTAGVNNMSSVCFKIARLTIFIGTEATSYWI